MFIQSNLMSLPSTEAILVKSALQCLETKLRYGSEALSSSQAVQAFLQLHLAVEKNEVFSVLFLDNRNRLLAFEKLFEGTVNEVYVYPRIIVQKALEHNAAAIILAHNHPSGHCEPSTADQEITRRLKTILDIINIRLLDHVIITYPNTYSFAECGLI